DIDVDTIGSDAKALHNHGGVIINGIDNCLVKFARCCNPLPGDTIIGFITKGKGVSIHKRDCANVPKEIDKAQEPDRWVNAHWEASISSEFKTTLYLDAYNRDGLMLDLLSQLSSMHVTIYSVNVRNSEDGYSNMEATISVNNVEHLQGVITRLSNIPSVISVKR
ncbi:MAG: bifunctional (p)ppGpp synthetase/guanosine-3',5'-bis(diphosphate) 3'-pyrophosphohydrolase, partial [Clostridia bacterium]|nr:bifunctional (p)ppGpp synthetase/guanosine-3',5'-bis(diphosphate) 3'-pyrophosphohydrolase [Clostridia bacterium]